MHNPEPTNKPYCCSKQAKWIVISPRLAYFYCETCKKEVQPLTALTNDEHDFYGEQLTLPGFSLYDPQPQTAAPVRKGITYQDVYDAVDSLRASDGNAYAPNSPNNPDTKSSKLTDDQHQHVVDKINEIYRVRWNQFDYNGYYKSTKK